MIPPMTRRILSRRALLAATAVTGLGTVSLSVSSSWAARFIRARIEEVFREVAPSPHTPNPGAWSDNAITLAWLGHATVLVNFYGVRVLTDPALFPRIGVDGWITSVGPLRLTACALKPGALPEVEPRAGVTRTFRSPRHTVPRGHSRPAGRWSCVEHLRPPSGAGDTGRCASSAGANRPASTRFTVTLRVQALEVKHWGARLGRDTYRGYNGYVIEREGRKLLFGGDTANTPLFATYRPLGPFEAAIMPIGAYNPWIHNHCTPEQAVALADAAGARLFVPVHHQSFALSREPFYEPIERSRAALAGEPDRLALTEIGQTVRLA